MPKKDWSQVPLGDLPTWRIVVYLIRIKSYREAFQVAIQGILSLRIHRAH